MRSARASPSLVPRKAPLGGEETGANSTDRAKTDTKRSLLTDGRGTPLAFDVSGVNTHDKWLVEDTVNRTPAPRPTPTKRHPQHLCLDKGCDYDDVRRSLVEYGYTAHIPALGTDPDRRVNLPGYRARRWVVERMRGSTVS